tara:strand:- start:1194 stop:1487 length:294 start_codon:yes stop_codon:yes gene_type:complete
MGSVREETFGPYVVEIVGNHATIRRMDGEVAQPSFYELQHIKSLAFGGSAVAVEIYPRQSDLVDGQHQRHLWCVQPETVPNLRTGLMVEIDTPWLER